MMPYYAPVSVRKWMKYDMRNEGIEQYHRSSSLFFNLKWSLLDAIDGV